MTYLYIIIAVTAEVFATLSLRESNNFTKIMPSIFVFIGYGLSLYLLAIIINNMNIAVTYALWSGLGLFLVTLSGVFLYGEKMDMAAVIGIVLILSGVIVIRIFSESVVN